MRSFFCVATALLATAGAYAQTNPFSIITPSNAVVCQPLLITWGGGMRKVPTSCVLPGADPSGQALESLGTFNGTSFTWTVNVAAGTSIGLTIRDSSGLVAQSAAFTINPGSDSSCVGKAVSGSAGTATSPAQTGSGSSPTTGTSGTTTGGAVGSSSTKASTGTGTSASTSATSTSSTKSNAASPANVAKVGTAGIVGIALAALLA